MIADPYTITFTVTDNHGQVAKKSVNLEVVEKRTATTTPTLPFITVLSPNGGEKWENGKTYDIKWTSSKVDKINIILYQRAETSSWFNNILVPLSVITNGYVPANLGKYSWKVPSNYSGDNFLIKMENAYGDVSDQSDKEFSIIKGTVATENVCNDTDKGHNYSIKGIVTDIYGSFTDYCKEGTNVLMEYYCSSGYGQTERYDCSGVCSNGACSEKEEDSVLTTTSTPTTPTCTDTDNGKNYSVQGTVTSGGQNYADYCLNESTLKEYFCSNKAMSEENYICTYGCGAGRCLTFEEMKGGVKLENIENQLADISQTVAGLLERIKEMLKR